LLVLLQRGSTYDFAPKTHGIQHRVLSSVWSVLGILWCGRTDGRTYVRTDGHVTITSLSKFLGLIGYQISLAMELRWRASALAPLLHQLGAGQLRVRIYPVNGKWMNINIRMIIYLKCGLKIKTYVNHRIIGEFWSSSLYKQDTLARWSSAASFGVLSYTDITTSPLIIGEFWSSFLYRQDYRAANHRRILELFLIQTGLSRRWSSASFGVLSYTDRTISPLIIGEFWSSFLYRQNYLAADHRRVLSCSLYRQNFFAADHRRVLEFFLIPTELLRCWSSASFGVPSYTDRTISPLIIVEFWSSFLYRQKYLAADHRQVLEFFLISTKNTSPLIIGEFSVLYIGHLAINHWM